MAVLTSKTNHVAQDLELGERRTTQSWSVLEQEDRDHPSHGCTRRQVSWLLFWIRRSLHLSDYLKAAACRTRDAEVGGGQAAPPWDQTDLSGFHISTDQ